MKPLKEFLKKHSLPAVIITALIFGLVGGLVGELAARAFLFDSLPGFWPLGSWDFSRGRYAEQGLVISNPKNVIVQQDAKVDGTIASVSSSLAGIYKKQRLLKSSLIFEPSNFYQLSQSVGQGFIITADGWLVTSLGLIKNYADYVVITQDKKIYQIDKAVADNLTQFNFIHIQAEDLPVRKFADRQNIKSGQLALAINWLGLSRLAAVAGFSRPDGLIRSSDSFSEKLLLDSQLSAEFAGSTIFNLAEEVLGLVNNKGEIEPIGHLVGAIRSLFKEQAVIRPSLGIGYVDLSELTEITGQNNYWRKGAVIYNSQKAPAVRKNSPAAQAGLRAGDVVMAVGDVYLDQNNDLAEIIQDQLAGGTVNLLVWRDGQEGRIKVILGEIR
jgi:S1-C subfamily serine protease